MGERGEQGPDGIAGTKGPDGPSGAAGPPGKSGTPGTPGTKGPDGAKGQHVSNTCRSSHSQIFFEICVKNLSEQIFYRTQPVAALLHEDILILINVKKFNKTLTMRNQQSIVANFCSLTG